MKLKLRKQCHPTNPMIRFNLDKLKDPEVASVFQAQLGGRFAALNLLDKDINEITGGFKNAILDTAEEVLGKERKKKQPWVSNDILDLCDRCKALKSSKHVSQEAAGQYRDTNRLVRTKMKEAKEKWISQQCKKIEIGMKKVTANKLITH